MAALHIYHVNSQTDTTEAGEIIVARYINNVKPTFDEIIKGDLWYTKYLARLFQYRQLFLQTQAEFDLCNYTINRFWEIKKLLVLLFNKNTNGYYTPCIPPCLNEIPDIQTSPLIFPTDWSTNEHAKLLLDSKNIALDVLSKLYKIYIPNATEAKILQFSSRNILDLNLYEIAAVVAKK